MGFTGRLKVLGIAIGVILNSFALNVTASYANEWKREYQFFENEVDSKCFVRTSSPTYLAFGYRKSGTSFISLGISEVNINRINSSENDGTVELAVHLEGKPTSTYKFTLNESEGSLYLDGDQAQEIRSLVEKFDQLQIEVKIVDEKQNAKYSFNTKKLTDTLYEIAYCNPNIKRFSVSKQKRVENHIKIHAFRHFTRVTNQRTDAVSDGLLNEKSLADLVRTSVIQTPYDCPPDLRVSCFEVLSNPDHKDHQQILHEWGDWEDSMKPGSVELDIYIKGHIQDAWNAGFAMFTAAEIRKVGRLLFRIQNEKKCELGYAGDGSILSDEARQKSCQEQKDDKAWLDEHYCFQPTLESWAECDGKTQSKNTSASRSGTSTWQFVNHKNDYEVNSSCFAHVETPIYLGFGFAGQNEPFVAFTPDVEIIETIRLLQNEYPKVIFKSGTITLGPYEFGLSYNKTMLYYIDDDMNALHELISNSHDIYIHVDIPGSKESEIYRAYGPNSISFLKNVRDCNFNNASQKNTKLNVEDSNLFTATCLALDSAIFGMSTRGFGGRDKVKNFNISVRKDGSVSINGQVIRPRYWEHESNSQLTYTAIPAEDVSIAIEGKLQAAQLMPNVSSEDLKAIEDVMKGFTGNALNGRDRVFFINPKARTFVFGDVVEGNLTNMANARCG